MSTTQLKQAHIISSIDSFFMDTKLNCDKGKQAFMKDAISEYDFILVA